MWILATKRYNDNYDIVTNIFMFNTKQDAQKKCDELEKLAEDNDYVYFNSVIEELVGNSFTITHERSYETISLDSPAS